MASISNFDIVGGFNEQPYQQFDSQRTLNMYARIDPEGKKPKMLVMRPGHHLKVNLALGSVIRNMLVHRNSLYAVSSSSVYKLDAAFSATNINGSLPLNSSVGAIPMAANANDEIIFVDGTGGYLYQNDGGMFIEIVDAHFSASPTAVAFLDGYFIVNNSGTNENYVSGLNDGTDWTSPDDTARRFLLTYKPDVVVGYAVLKRNLFVFGQICGEVWNNIGAAGDIPFRRNNSLSMEYGCESASSIAVGHGLLFWLSRTPDGVGSVMMTDGTQPFPVSTPALDIRIQSYGATANAIGYVYKISGHIFYDLIFPTEGTCWMYDVNTRLWSEKSALNGGRYIANCHAFFADIHLLGAYNSKIIYEMSDQYFDDAGEAIHWLRIPRQISEPTYRRIRVDRIQIDMVMGRAASNGVDATPEIFLSASRDGGVTYSSPQRKIYTQSGQYKSRAVWHRQGVADQWAFKLEGYTKQPTQMMGGSIQYEVLRS